MELDYVTMSNANIFRKDLIVVDVASQQQVQGRKYTRTSLVCPDVSIKFWIPDAWIADVVIQPS